MKFRSGSQRHVISPSHCSGAFPPILAAPAPLPDLGKRRFRRSGATQRLCIRTHARNWAQETDPALGTAQGRDSPVGPTAPGRTLSKSRWRRGATSSRPDEPRHTGAALAPIERSYGAEGGLPRGTTGSVPESPNYRPRCGDHGRSSPIVVGTSGPRRDDAPADGSFPLPRAQSDPGMVMRFRAGSPQTRAKAKTTGGTGDDSVKSLPTSAHGQPAVGGAAGWLWLTGQLTTLRRRPRSFVSRETLAAGSRDGLHKSEEGAARLRFRATGEPIGEWLPTNEVLHAFPAGHRHESNGPQTLRWPTVAARARRLGHCKRAAEAQERCAAFRHESRGPERPRCHQIECAPQFRIMSEVLGSAVDHGDAIAPGKHLDRVV